MELEKHMCENFRQQYPDDYFAAFMDSTSAFIDSSRICDMNVSRVWRLLILSSSFCYTASSLKVSRLRIMWRGRDTCQIRSKQCFWVYCASVFVTPVSSNDRPLVFGPRKGLAYFWELEFGEQVTVVLH